MSKAWEPYALHILDSIAKIRRIESRGDVRSDEVLYDAALRILQILSEATQRLPEALKQGYKEVPWREISGIRNILVHDYLGNIDPEVVAQVIRVHLPALEALSLQCSVGRTRTCKTDSLASSPSSNLARAPTTFGSPRRRRPRARFMRGTGHRQ